jgi:hypothetical protein
MHLDSLRNTPPFDRLLLLLSRWTPQCDRVLVVESGARAAADKFLRELYSKEQPRQVDVLTCYRSAPDAFDARLGQVYFTHNAGGGAARKQLFHSLTGTGYSAVCVLCTGDAIMTKWKWMVACRVPAKLLIVNENADSFWLDRGHIIKVRHMLRERMGLHRITPLRILSQAIRFPFTLAALLAFASVVHARRLLRARHS